MAPEGSAILTQYWFGKGDTLQLNPEYISRSPVVRNALKGLQPGAVRRVTITVRDNLVHAFDCTPFAGSNHQLVDCLDEYVPRAGFLTFYMYFRSLLVFSRIIPSRFSRRIRG